MRHLALYLFLAIASTCAAQSTLLWQIGKSDQSAKEFPIGPVDHISYEIEKNHWEHDWAATQAEGAPYKITFTLQSISSGRYTLHTAIQAATSLLPALHIQINGHRGNFYLHPQLTKSALDYDLLPLADLNIDIPAQYLHPGANNITLTCVPANPADATTARIKYDYLSFTHDKAPQADPISATLAPTIFYRERGSQLTEVIDATIRYSQPTSAGEAELTLNGHLFTAPLSEQKDFGEQHIQFEVPEWSGPAKAHLLIKTDNHKDFILTLQPARKWKLFVVPHTHLDIGYTDYQGKVAEVQARALQDSIHLIRQHPDFRFSTDGSWNVEQFLESRSPELQRELMDTVKSGKIGVPATYANLLTGYASLETLYRSLYYSKSLAREYGIPFNYAAITDVPSYTGAYPSILAKAGIRYLAAGGNSDRGPMLQHEPWNAKSPFWWQGTDGSKVLFWYAHGYGQIEAIFGLPPEMPQGRDTLPLFLSTYTQPNYHPDAVLIYGAQSENTQIEPALAGFATEWNSAYAYPKLQYSTFIDFFQYIEHNYGTTLATYKGDMGPYWEDGILSDVANTTQDRLNQNRALSVDILGTAAHLLGQGFHPPKTELDSAWKNIQLYAEHTWTGGMSVTQPHMERVVGELAVKDNRATQAKFQLEDVANRSIAQLTDQIHVSASTLVVFNALNWKRDVLVETDLRWHEHLIDLTTNKEVPVEVLWRREGFTRARFIVPDVPPVGYKCLRFKVEKDNVSDTAQNTSNNIIENQFYRITVDPSSGSLRSIFDKQLQRELVDQASSYRFAQYLYVIGGDGATRIVRSDPAYPVPQLQIHTTRSGKYLGTSKTPWGQAIHLQSSTTNTPLVDLEVLLFDNEKKIAFNFKVDKQCMLAKEGVYFAFPIAANKPQFSYEIQQGWINPATDLMSGGSAEWFSIQHWMAVHNSDLAVAIVPVDAPMASFGDVVRGRWPGEFHAASSTLFSYAMNNYWHTNYQAGQGGTFNFRYIMTSTSQFSPSAFSKLGWENMEPVELNRLIPPDKIGDPDRPLPASGASFLEVAGDNVILTDWKIAEDGKGTILRLQETAGKSTQATVHIPRLHLQAATLCNAVEDNQQSLAVQNDMVSVNLKPFEVVTIRLQTKEGSRLP
ncbi:MAG: hypothetical protein JSS87_14605 [Acidobacteria bacterium]|nr:hypothetical protein [Acidobacteriota bacterium]